MAEHFVQLAAPHALVAPVAEREHHRVAHQPFQRGQVAGRAADPDQYTLVMIASSWAKPWVRSKFDRSKIH